MNFVYILEASGLLLSCGSRHVIRSSTCFTTKEKAEQRIAKFKELITNPQRLNALDDDEHLQIYACELEIVE